MSETSPSIGSLTSPIQAPSEWQHDRYNNFDLRGASKWDLHSELTRVQLRLALDPEPAEWLTLRERAIVDALGQLRS